MEDSTLASSVDDFLGDLRARAETLLRNHDFGLYLVGSRAEGNAITTSDLDLALVIPTPLTTEDRMQVQQAIDVIGRASPLPVDTTLVTGEYLRTGTTPKLLHGKLISGRDLLKDVPLKPKSELMLYYTGLVAHFVQGIRGNPERIRIPLDYPEESGEFHGYERHGIRVNKGSYVAGLNMLVNLVLTLGTFRLAWLADVFTPSKNSTAARYREILPQDPWCDVIEDMYQVGRLRWQGRIPISDDDRARVAACCARVLDLENECLNIAFDNLAIWLAGANPGFQQQAFGLLQRVSCVSATDSAKLDRIKELAARAARGGARPS